MEIFTDEGGQFLSRWGHVISGITWIGLLYYFNFVQTPAFAGFEAPARNESTAKLVPRALWWFRWAAMLTLLTGLMILGFQEQTGQVDGDYFKQPPGISISTGILFAVTMWANVWFVIWPAQKKVIANAENVLAGREADPTIAATARRGALASRTNTFFSIPMLWFMVATSHFVPGNFATSDNRAVYWIIVLVLWAIFELNGLGVFGTSTGGPRVYLDDHRNTIIAGLVFMVGLYVLWEILFSR